MTNKKNKLSDDKILQSIVAEIEQLAKEVVGDYKKTPSEMSGSTSPTASEIFVVFMHRKTMWPHDSDRAAGG